MRIMLMAQHYAPEEVSGAVLATELAEDLVSRGHQVTFITCAPNYPYGKVFNGYYNVLYTIEMLNGVRVIRVWSYISPDKGFWARILNYGTFSLSALFGGMIAGKPDVILSASPPLPLGMSAWLLSFFWNVAWVLRVEDLFPDAAISLGWLRNRIAIKFFYAIERFQYKNATLVSLISEGFAQNLKLKGVPSEKIVVLPVWADPKEIYPMPKENEFRKAHQLNRRFVIMYSGNLGYTSSLNEVISAAEQLQDQPKLQFVIVGEGVKKEALQDLAYRKNLFNISFLPYQPRDLFPKMLAAADVHLVTLNRRMSNTSLPSKVFTALASGRPILAIAPMGCEVANLINGAKCGFVVEPEQPHLLADVVLQLMQDENMRDEMGKNGRMKLETDFSRQRIIDCYESILEKALQTKTAEQGKK